MHGVKKNSKPFQHLKLIHNEHSTKLNQKNTVEIDLLEDMKGFLKQKNNLEREYMLAIHKLSTQYIAKRENESITSNSSEGKEVLAATSNSDVVSSSSTKSSTGRQPSEVWKIYLKHEQGHSSLRLQALECQQEMVNQLKPLRSQRVAANKRLIEQLRSLQTDLVVGLQEMLKSHKVYVEEEKQCREAKLKSRAAEEKVRRRSTNLFHSMAQLQRTCNKLCLRRDECINRATTARNEYLFQLAALNAHLQHYYNVDVPEIAKALDGEVHIRVRELLHTVFQQDLESAKFIADGMGNLAKDVQLIQRDYSWKEFLQINSIFIDMVQYQFEPMENDRISLLHPPNPQAETLINVGRKLIKRLLAHQRRMRAYENEVRALQGGGRVTPILSSTGCRLDRSISEETTPMSTNDSGLYEVALNTQLSNTNCSETGGGVVYNLEYVEHKVEELQYAIRREEIEKVKIEACLKLLTDSGVNVQDMLIEANRAAAAYEAEQLHHQQRLRLQHQQSLSSSTSSWDPRGGGVVGSGGGGVGGGNGMSIGRSPESVTESSIYHAYVRDSGGFSYPFVNPMQLPPDAMMSPYEISGSMLDDVCSLRRVKLTDEHPLHFGHRQREHSTAIPKAAPRNSLRKSENSNHSGNEPTIQSNGQQDIHETGDGSIHSGDTLQSGDQDAEETELGVRATAMFEYQALRNDELDLVVYETVLILSPGDADGWLKVKSLLDGRVGLIPEAYIHLDDPHRDAGRYAALKAGLLDLTIENSTAVPICPTHGPRLKGDGAENVDDEDEDEDEEDLRGNYENWNEEYENWEPRLPPRHKAPPKIKTDLPIKNVYFEPSCDIVRSVLHFTATHEDELSFSVNQYIRVLSRTTAIGGVDDGWWEGELIQTECSKSLSLSTSSSLTASVKSRGLFPSMLVRPAALPNLSGVDSQRHDPLTEDIPIAFIQPSILSPCVDRPGPPSFSPPPPTTTTTTTTNPPTQPPPPPSSSSPSSSATATTATTATNDNLTSDQQQIAESVAGDVVMDLVDFVISQAVERAKSHESEADEYVQISFDAEYRFAEL